MAHHCDLCDALCYCDLDDCLLPQPDDCRHLDVCPELAGETDDGDFGADECAVAAIAATPTEEPR